MIQKPGHPIRFTALSLLALGVAVVSGYLAVRSITTLGDMPCNVNDTYSGWRIVAVSAGTFVLGHLAGYPRRRHVQPMKVHERPARVALFVHGLLFAFFLLVTLALVYETVSLWAPPGEHDSVNPWGLQPITNYVRCSKSVAPWWTTIIVAVISFFIGHWLCPPLTRGRHEVEDVR